VFREIAAIYIEYIESTDLRSSVLLHQSLKWPQLHATYGSAVPFNHSDTACTGGNISLLISGHHEKLGKKVFFVPASRQQV
jgi:hypothetical protein